MQLQALTGMKPDLSKHEWGRRAIVHDTTNSKLSRRVKQGIWVVVNAKSKVSHIYWPDKMMVSIE